MEEKQSVVIQGRTIDRERPRDRSIGASGSLRTRMQRDEIETESDSPFRLSDLRESRRASGAERAPVRPRTRSYASYSSPDRENRKDGPKINSLRKKIAISVLVGLLLFLLDSIKLPWPQAAMDKVRAALTYETDWDEALGKLKFVGESLPEEIRSVFGQKPEEPAAEESQPDFHAPIKGEVIHTFREQVALESAGGVYRNQGIDIAAEPEAPFYATASGIVAAVEEHETYGPSLWIDHGNQVFSFYGRCGKIKVKAGQSVGQGEKLGTVESPPEGEEPVLHFEIWMDDKPVDPLEVINHAGSKSSVQGSV